MTDAYFFTKGFQTSAFVCFCRNLSPRSNQLSDNSTSNKQTLYEELLTMSFNRLSYQSLTSRKNWDALKVLKEDDSIKVPPGDKGHASIVMNINNYHVKMSNLIKNRPYQLLNKEPTDRKVVQKAASLEVTWTSIRGHLQQHQTLSQKNAKNLRHPTSLYPGLLLF